MDEPRLLPRFRTIPITRIFACPPWLVKTGKNRSDTLKSWQTFQDGAAAPTEGWVHELPSA